MNKNKKQLIFEEKEKEFIKILVLINQAIKQGYNTEINHIIGFMLKNGIIDIDYIETDNNNKFDNSNYCDILSLELTDTFNCCYPCFTLTDLKQGVLSGFYGSSVDNLSLHGIELLFGLQDLNKLELTINHDKTVEAFKQHLKTVLFDLSNDIEALNKFLVTYYTLNGCYGLNDIVFKHNNKLYIKYDIDNSSIIESSETDLKQFINDFVDALEYIEDITLIYVYILDLVVL